MTDVEVDKSTYRLYRPAVFVKSVILATRLTLKQSFLITILLVLNVRRGSIKTARVRPSVNCAPKTHTTVKQEAQATQHVYVRPLLVVRFRAPVPVVLSSDHLNHSLYPLDRSESPQWRVYVDKM